MSDQSVCLCMIVKNEAPVIRRCLASARPLITHWLVVDTGSSDGTQNLVRAALAGLPGELVERPWIDFAHNRSEALALARPHAAYSLMIDADDVFDLAPGFALPALAADSYTVDIHYNGTVYRRPQLVRNALPWRYRGVLHEFLECSEATSQGHLPLVMRINHEGARSTDAQTYVRDAAILERALADETDPFLVARYTFYLAQSYRDCGEPAKAAAAYLRRADMGFWDEEVFVSLYQAGRMLEASGADPDAALDAYTRASAAVPSRAEAAHAAARLCRGLQRFAQGYALAEPSLGLSTPPAGLFVEPWIYAYGLADEYAVNAYWCGRFRACLDGCLRALASGQLPSHEQRRVLDNMRFALDRLPGDPAEPAVDPPEDARAGAPLTSTLHLGSGKDFRADCFNVDIDASWHPDALIDFSAIDLGTAAHAVDTARFGKVLLRPSLFNRVVANDVLEHVPDLVRLMTNCLALLRIGGLFEIQVPYDLAFGAWQDPTHRRAFNERSWLYYTDWFWYLGWREARFVLDALEHVLSPLGLELRAAGQSIKDIHRTPRAVDAMRVTLRKIELTPADRVELARCRGGTGIAGPLPAAEQTSPVVLTGLLPPPAFPSRWLEARERYCIYMVSPPDYPHVAALHDAAQGLSDAFVSLGGSAPLVTDAADWKGRTPIVFGSHLLSQYPVAKLPADAVLFNTEPVDAASPWLEGSTLALMRSHPLLDYSERNTRALATLGLDHASHLAIRAMPQPVPAAEPPRDIDVLFFGSMNERRRTVLDALRARGLAVTELFGTYGAKRDALVARSKIVLNLHYYEAAIFESARVCPLLAAGACVVSEGDPDDPDVADIAAGLVLCPLSTIADSCSSLVADPDARAVLSTQARETISARSQAVVLRAAFPDAPQPN